MQASVQRWSLLFTAIALSSSGLVSAQPVIAPFTGPGVVAVTNVFTNGVATLEGAPTVIGPWEPLKNVFTTSAVTQVSLATTGAAGFYRVGAWNIAGGNPGFTNLTRAYGVLTTIAGAGGIQDVNHWLPEYEGAQATNVILSSPHIAIANRKGEIFIADKDAHGIRKIRLDGTLVTVAGTNSVGNGPDESTPGTEVGLNGPNGIWVGANDVVFILDTGNGKVRRLDTNGMMQTLFTVPGGLLIGRGIWVSDDETTAYVCSTTVVKRWTAAEGVSDFSIGYSELGNIAMGADGRLVVTDRSAHYVYRLDGNGARTVIAGNGLTSGGGDGQLAVNTSVRGVRGIWFMPNGAYFLATHRGSQVWYVDVDGYIHLWIQGDHNGAHAGDGTWFYNPTQARVQDCRAVTMDFAGNLLITENDLGYIRKVRFLPFTQ